MGWLFHASIYNPQEFMFAEFMDTNNVEQIQEFMEDSIKGTLSHSSFVF